MMMVSYGMVFDNSPYARVTLLTSNIFKDKKEFKQLFKVCLVIGCFDTSVLQYKKLGEDIERYGSYKAISKIEDSETQGSYSYVT
jgi:hypothetical protein